MSLITPALAAEFAAPPAEDRVMMRWWWFGVGADEADLTRELESMRSAGIGGVEAAFLYPLDPDPRQPAFLSTRFRELLRHAADEAHRLGLRFDLTLGSGWSYGGAHIPSALAAKRVRFAQRATGPHGGDLPVHGDWPEDRVVAAYVGEGQPGDRRGGWSPLEIVDDTVHVPAGRGPRTLLLAIAGPTGQQVKRAGLGAEGPVLDHYSAEATRHHLASVGDALLDAAGGPGRVHAVFCDSLEVYDADWTDDILAEFARRRGYDALPLLPALHVHADPVFRADWHRTLGELAEERFLGELADWARERGVRLRVQNYGEPPTTASAFRHADLIEGEGWGWRGIPQTKWASSAAHHLGVDVVSSETWTWVNSPSFRAVPLDLKGEAHEHALSGVTRFVGHGWPSSPRVAAAPGWAMYASGALSDRNAWWPVAPELFAYLQRLSTLMRRGEHIADVGVWLPYDGARASFAHGGERNLWRRCAERVPIAVTTAIRAAGYDFDVVDAGMPAIARRHRVVVVTERPGPDDAAALSAVAAAGVAIVAVDADLGVAGARRTSIDDLGGCLAAIVAPDAPVDRAETVGVVHRRLDDGDLYLVANTSASEERVELHPRTPFTRWERWDAHDGSVAEGAGSIRLVLAPYEAALVVTGDGEPGAHEPADAAGERRSLRLEEWDVVAPDGSTRRVPLPHRWEEDETGTVVYRARVSLDRAARAELGFDLAGWPVPARTATQPQSFQAHAAMPVGAVARVRVDGQDVGAIWDAPWRLALDLPAGASTIDLAVSSASVAELRDPAWRRIFADAERVHGVRFTMQDIDVSDEAHPAGLFATPVLVIG
ncbi:glycosyl hydrolase [Microbacterium gilvum]|uniref:Glycosyl hydrolase n=1 Tax=Microbacterium gilvum TaxID=1336204 RepID=A0ABP9ARP0_9MICO